MAIDITTTSTTPTITSITDGAAKAAERRAREGRYRIWSQAALETLTVMISAELLVYGGVRTDIAVKFSMVFCLLAVVLALFPLERRTRSIFGNGYLLAAGAGFVLVELWAAITLLPCPPAMAPRIWAGLRGAPALTVDRLATLTEMVKLAGLASVFYIGWTVSRDPASLKRVIHRLVAIATLYAIGSIVLFAIDPNSVFGVAKTLHAGRLTGSFLSANTAASLLAALLALFLSLAITEMVLDRKLRVLEERMISTIIVALPIPFLLGALFMTGSRSGVLAGGFGVALSVGLALMAIIDDGRWNSRIGWVLGLGSAGVMLGVLLFWPSLVHSPLGERFATLADAAGERSQMIQLLSPLVAQRPMTGYGLGGFEVAKASVVSASNFRDLWPVGSAQNVFLQWLIEGGFIGAALMFLTVTILGAGACVRSMTAGSRGGTARAALAFAGVLFAHNMVDGSLEVPAVAALLSLLLGLALGPAASEADL